MYLFKINIFEVKVFVVYRVGDGFVYYLYFLGFYGVRSSRVLAEGVGVVVDVEFIRRLDGVVVMLGRWLRLLDSGL